MPIFLLINFGSKHQAALGFLDMNGVVQAVHTALARPLPGSAGQSTGWPVVHRMPHGIHVVATLRNTTPVSSRRNSTSIAVGICRSGTSLVSRFPNSAARLRRRRSAPPLKIFCARSAHAIRLGQSLPSSRRLNKSHRSSNDQIFLKQRGFAGRCHRST